VKQSWIGALAFVLAIPMVGHAASPADVRTSVKVSLYGFDPSRPDGAAAVLRRLDSAAMEVCGAPIGSLREYRLAVRHSDCHAASLDRAVAQLDDPAVTALYDRERAPAIWKND
jgi:UrcA family protein